MWAFHLVTLVFVIAKILGYVAFSWWVAFAPSLIGMAIPIFALLFSLVLIAWLKR